MAGGARVVIAAAAFSLVALLAPAADLAAAQEHYRAGRYAQALAGFEETLAKGPADARVLFDAGNCHYRLGRFAEAALAYRRALLRAPRDSETRFNLGLAEQRLGIPRPASEPLLAALRAVATQWTPAERLAGAFLLQAAGLAGALAFRRRRGLRIASGLVVSAGLIAGASAATGAIATPLREGLVLAPEAQVTREPRADLPVVLTLKAGEVVTVEERSERWTRILHADGRGWVASTSVGVID